MKKALLISLFIFGLLLTACSPTTMQVTGKVISITRAEDYTRIELSVDNCVAVDNSDCGLSKYHPYLYFPVPDKAREVEAGDTLELACLTTGWLEISPDSCNITAIR